MVEPSAPVAAIIERPISVEGDLRFGGISLQALTSALWGLTAEVWILAVVVAVTAPSERSISAEIARIWVAASPDVANSDPCASRALLRIEAAGSAPTGLQA